ncbi:MAG: PEFG-CTERM sorting domain-containing protein [Thaumarchaeota archaeon]|nr:PEFG-CTERM sorting domain-containing protein [Nitrososphaerota archaeon]
MSSAYAIGHDQAAGVMNPEDAKALANKMLLEAIPVSVWTDKTDYGHNDMIMVKGHVANVSGNVITLTVFSPLNSIVTIAQFNVAEDGSFETTLNTAGALWKYDGTYIIKVNYGSPEKSNKVKVELTGGVTFTPDFSTPTTDKQCSANEISADGHCIPYSISGGMVISATLNTDENSIIINIDAEDDGILTVSPSKTVQDGIFMVLVDGEEWDDVEIVGNEVTVMFPAGTEQIQIIGTFVIPEFGTIAAMILAVAIISIIVISAKSRLSIIPRY